MGTEEEGEGRHSFKIWSGIRRTSLCSRRLLVLAHTPSTRHWTPQPWAQGGTNGSGSRPLSTAMQVVGGLVLHTNPILPYRRSGLAYYLQASASGPNRGPLGLSWRKGVLSSDAEPRSRPFCQLSPMGVRKFVIRSVACFPFPILNKFGSPIKAMTKAPLGRPTSIQRPRERPWLSLHLGPRIDGEKSTI